MNKKYIKYINHIVNDIKPPYFINMRDNYGLRSDEYELVLSKVYDQPITINGKSIEDHNGNEIYYEDSNGYWYKNEFDQYGNNIYYETSDGFWYKGEYDQYGNLIYSEDSNGRIYDNR